MTRLDHRTMFPAAISLIAFWLSMAGSQVQAVETERQPRFEEHRVEFHNQDVKLAGSLLLPIRDAPVPGVVFVHGAGPQTREPYREAGEYFASQGIAALIYDKRGVGQSSGTYESHRPYKNLVNDALAAIACLKQRREIAPSQVGIWGLSQGTEIGAAAASRSKDIQFIIAVGGSAADPDASMFYYRDNLFRKYGLSNTLRDLAEKLHLVQYSLPHNLPNGLELASFAPRSYPSPEQYVHPAWRHVHQPVLAMWGQLDQNQPVGESVAALKNSLAQANNEQWTMIILPRASHSLGISETGELQSKWRGYPPGALRTMTDWVHGVIADPPRIDTMTQMGLAEVKGVLPKLARYEKLRWYGNGTIQAALWILFLICFLASSIASIRNVLFRRFRPQKESALSPADSAERWARVIHALNLLILILFSVVAWLVLDQLRPSCPVVLRYLPVLGTVSTLATVAFMIVLARTPRDHGWTTARRIGFVFQVVCLILFIPFMCYWNLIGFHF